jgi:hypothetical protein
MTDDSIRPTLDSRSHPAALRGITRGVTMADLHQSPSEGSLLPPSERGAPVVSAKQIEIAADPEAVWEVLAAFDRWPSWNPR